jgi:hypothetical protein
MPALPPPPSTVASIIDDLPSMGVVVGSPDEKSDIRSSRSSRNGLFSESIAPAGISVGPTGNSARSRAPAIRQRLSSMCLNLPPAFFSINMGTGITSILLYTFPYPAEWLRILGMIIFILNIVIFSLLALGNAARYWRYKGVFNATISHNMAGMFWGTLPMGFATIVVSAVSTLRGNILLMFP